MLYLSSVAVLFALVLTESNGQAIKEFSASTESSDTVYPELWIPDLFYQALANFTMRDVGSTACQNQGEMYEKNLRNHTNWAVKMAESWERHPIGILTGHRFHFGVYDECVTVNYPIKGQYCLTEIKLTSLTKNGDNLFREDNLDRVYNSHSWKTILEWINFPDRIPRNVLNLGICIPNSCTASDLQTSLQKEINKVFLPKKVNASVKVNEIMCTVSENKYPYDTGYYITSALLGLLIVICCGTTIIHYITLSCKQNKARENSFVNTFSLINSIKVLFRYDKNNELNVINGFKVTTMVFVLFGHRFIYLVGYPIIYSPYGEDIYTGGPDMLLTSMNLVDPFFFMSGYLTYLVLSPEFKKSGSALKKFTFPIIYRVVRMLPPYCAMMAITAYIIPHLGDGPLWPQKIWDEAEQCKNYWWANILFISNFIDAKNQCLIISWYLSCDMHFFIIGIIIVYVCTKNMKYGIGLLITTLGLSLSVPFLVTILTKSDGILKVYVPFLENPRSSNHFNESYRLNYMRGAPYFMGLAVYLVIEKSKETKFKLSKKSVYAGTFVICMISIWIQLYGAIFYKRQRPYYPLEHALYSVFSHCTWSMIGAWVFFCHFTTGFGLITKVISNRLLVILGRLSYAILLVNFTVMMVSQSSQRISEHFSIKSALNVWIYDLFKCYFMGLLLHLVIEAPFGNIFKMLLGRGKLKESSTKGTPVESHQNTTTNEINLQPQNNV